MSEFYIPTTNIGCNRRGFFRIAGIGLAGILLSCSPDRTTTPGSSTAIPTTIPPTQTPLPTVMPTPDACFLGAEVHANELARVVQSLPASSVRSFIAPFHAELLGHPCQSFLDIEGTLIPYRSITFRTGTTAQASAVSGDLSFRREGEQLPLHASQDTVVFLPYPNFLLTNEDLAYFRQAYDGSDPNPFLSDEQLSMMISYDQDGLPIYSGTSPVITIRIGDNINLQNETHRALYEMILLKEFTNFYVDIWYLKYLTDIMSSYGVPTQISTVDKSGQIQETEILSHSFVDMQNRSGRTLAALDIMPTLLIAVAFRDSPLHWHVLSRQPFSPALIRAIDELEGLEGDELIIAAFEFIIDNPVLCNVIPHNGNLNNIP